MPACRRYVMRSVVLTAAMLVWYPASAIETQWTLERTPMQSYIENGYRLVQAFSRDDPTSVLWVYLLQKDASVVRCSERRIFGPQRSATIRNELYCHRLVIPFEEK
jgi:hypothetical protein